MSVKGPKTKVVGRFESFVAGSGTIAAPPFACVAEAWLIGAGATATNSGGNGGGGGGGATYRRFRTSPGQQLPWVVGAGNASGVVANGGDTMLTLPSGNLRASGGITNSGATGGLGGTGFGGDTNRAGGAGGNGGTPGGAGDHGGAGGVNNSGGGGGGAAGFSDLGYPLGGSGGGVSGPVGTGGGAQTSQSSNDGGLSVIFTRIVGA
jgi:hypothetical protein